MSAAVCAGAGRECEHSGGGGECEFDCDGGVRAVTLRGVRRPRATTALR